MLHGDEWYAQLFEVQNKASPFLLVPVAILAFFFVLPLDKPGHAITENQQLTDHKCAAV